MAGLSILAATGFASLVSLDQIHAQQQTLPSKFYRPKRQSPPVHATPETRPTATTTALFGQRTRHPDRVHPGFSAGQPATARPIPSLQTRQPSTTRQQQSTTRQFPVRQASRLQQDFTSQATTDTNAQPITAGKIGDQDPVSFQQQTEEVLQQTAEQWRTRSQQALQQADSFLRSTSQGNQPSFQEYNTDAAPQFSIARPGDEPQQGSATNRFSDVAMPETELNPGVVGQIQSQADSNPFHARPFATTPSDLANPPATNGFETNNQSPAFEQSHQGLRDQNLNSNHNPFSNRDSLSNQAMPSTDGNPVAGSTSREPQSVLVDQHPLRQQNNASVQNDASVPGNHPTNSLRGMRIEPRRASGLRNVRRSNSRNQPSFPAGYRQDTDDQGSGSRSSSGQNPKSCDDFRTELLNNPITDIVLDIAPPKPTTDQGTTLGLTRTWTDCSGNFLGQGTLDRLEQSFIVVIDDAGNSQRIPINQLGDNELAIVSDYWGLPAACSLGCFPFEGRHWTNNSFFWKASALCHKPLYFENRQLERYGHTHGPIIEPLRSSAHFFTSLLLWPYNTGINPPNECLYALGFYRPGDCAPWLREPFPISLNGALRQGAFIGAAVPIIP